MCIAMPKPSVPPPPPPKPTPPPAPPKAVSPEVKRAKTSARTVAALAQGRSATLLGGQIDTPATTAKKTLLGA